MYKDGNGFPLMLKPSHLYGSTERMDVAEVLSAIVEEACRYSPDVPVGVQNIKRLKALTSVEPKEARTSGELKEARTSGEQKGALTKVEKVPVVASDFVRITLFKAVGFVELVGLIRLRNLMKI